MRAVGGAGRLRAALARSLGVPGGPVASARAVLDGVSRRLDLLVDDSDGVVLGSLGIPPASVPAEPVGVGARPPGCAPWSAPSPLRPPGSGSRSTASR